MAKVYIFCVWCLMPFFLVKTNGETLRFRPSNTYKFPFQDPSLSWNARVDDLVGRLTLEEVVLQSMALYQHHTPAVPRLGIQPYVWITECIRGQVGTNTTAFPQSLGLAATFSPDLLFSMAEAISLEVRAHWNTVRRDTESNVALGVSCFSPVINIMRHPLWGRNQETYGECPYLSGTLVQSFVRGLQGNNSRYVRVNAGCKHFDVHGGPEDIPESRFSFDSKVSVRDWRMTFLPQFKMCVEAGTYNLMCSYNSINGVPACANTQLLTTIARKEWGFTGYVVSDDLAIPMIQAGHNYTNTTIQTAIAAIRAGCNMELGSKVYMSQLDAVKQGLLSESEVRENIKPMFYTRLRLGEFDPEQMVPYNKINMSVVQSQAHRELAINAATMSFVLLKNSRNTLPIKKKIQRLAVVGPMANNTEQIFGNYASNVVPQFTKTPYQGLQQLADITTYASGCDDTKCAHYNADYVIDAVQASDVTVVCLGTGQAVETESHDRKYLDLPGKQLQLLKDVVQITTGRPIILLMFNAGPLDVTWAKLSLDVDVIMACFFPAQSTGDALYRSLTAADAQSVPAARLPATWPANLEQIPPMEDYSMAGRTYRYYQGSPLYPFGYGLSYSQFKYRGLTVSPSVVSPNHQVAISVTVINLGPYQADEVIQVYMSWLNHTDIAPHLQLVGYKRINLQVQKMIKVDFVITPDQMALWLDEKHGFKVLPGKMGVSVGGQQPDQTTKVTSNVVMAQFEIQDTSAR